MSKITAAGFVALIGPPNVGKSTLLNQLVGQKVSIATHKSQTTRSRITGIALHEKAQIIFHDLPGIFNAGKKFDKAMVRAAWSGLSNADIGLVLIDSEKGLSGQATEIMLEKLREWREDNTDLCVALNKADLVEKPDLLPLAQKLEDFLEPEKIFMISAKTGAGCEDMLSWLAKKMPEGPWLYDEQDVTDLPAKLMAAEFTREQIFKNLHQEIPYECTVQTQTLETRKNQMMNIEQTIFVRKNAHKGIVIGKAGQTLKRIGSAARREIERAFEQKVNLQIRVKVQENWNEDPDVYKMWGLD